MARKKTFSGAIETITETKGGDIQTNHWRLVEGTAQGVMDFLNENGIPGDNVKEFILNSSTWYAWYHL